MHEAVYCSLKNVPAPSLRTASWPVCAAPLWVQLAQLLFADAATGLLTGAGIPANRIRVERFGPTR